MSQPNTLNPYLLIGQQIQSGLNSIISGLPVNPTIDDLVNEVFAYVQPIYYPGASQVVTMEVKSVAYNAINSYRNDLVLNNMTFYHGQQTQFIQMLIGSDMTVGIAPDSFQDRITDIEENIGTSALSVNDQQPLFLGTTIGYNANQYWLTEIANPNSAWIGHFSTNPGQNYMNSILWSTAAINGALASYQVTSKGLIEPTIDIVTTNIVSALIGALTITAGKVIFNWIPVITKPLEPSLSVLGSSLYDSRVITSNHEYQGFVNIDQTNKDGSTYHAVLSDDCKHGQSYTDNAKGVRSKTIYW
ncbi:MAG: hypothetical protein KF744_12990 [Taibaiella sp.]|nr:hypothetical protein [Taibaiella sp.]